MNALFEKIKNMVVIGAGTMGKMISLQASLAPLNIILVDISKQSLDNAQNYIHETLKNWVDLGEITEEERTSRLKKIVFSTDLKTAASNADFVIEAIYEEVGIKQKMFENLDQFCRADTVLCTNTSALRPSIIGEHIKLKDRFLAVNFECPVWEQPMVEIMSTSETSDETYLITKKLIESIQLTPITVKKEINGYVANRIWRAIKKESMFLVDEGYSTIEDVDKSFIILYGCESGPFMQMDMIGLDSIMKVEERYFDETGDPSDRPRKILRDLVEKGNLGVKTGKGFYTYPNPIFETENWKKLIKK
jgi:3-hydroxybutyryl-CoA dehydrogenase